MSDSDADVVLTDTETTIVVESEPVVNIVTVVEEVEGELAAETVSSIIYTENESVVTIESEQLVDVISTEEEATVIVSIETGPQGPPGKDGSPETLLTRLVDSESEEDIVYVGEAVFESEESDSVWRIYKVDFTGITTKKWAEGNAEFVNKWTERLTLTYS